MKTPFHRWVGAVVAVLFVLQPVFKSRFFRKELLESAVSFETKNDQDNHAIENRVDEDHHGSNDNRVYEDDHGSNDDDDIRTSEMPPRGECSSNGYLLYMTSGGWSNQRISLQFSYYLALATNRTLVLPPILPQWAGNWIFIELWDHILPDDEERLGLDYMSTIYLRNFSSVYTPMENILDSEYTLPGVATIGFEDFYEECWNEEENTTTTTTTTEWVVERNFTYQEHRFVFRRPDLDHTKSTEWDAGIPWYRRKPFRVFRDVAKLKEEFPQDAWCLFDPYFHTLGLHDSMIPIGEDPDVFHGRFRFSRVLREAARAIHEDFWRSLPYAAVHIRGGDAYFAEEERIQRAIDSTMDGVLEDMLEWLEHRREKGDEIPAKVGLFIATDIMGILTKLNMWEKYTVLNDTLTSSYGVSVELFHNDVSPYQSEEFYQRLQNASVIADSFLDQQLAGCAAMGFRGTNGSTYSKLIESIQGSPGACAL